MSDLMVMSQNNLIVSSQSAVINIITLHGGSGVLILLTSTTKRSFGDRNLPSVIP